MPYLRSRGATALVALALCAMTSSSVARAADDSVVYHDAARFVHSWNWMLTDIMVDEIRTPCNISRVYSYANVAAYEAALPGFPKCRSFDGQLNGLTDIPKPAAGAAYDWRVSMVMAYKLLADKLLFKTYRADSLYDANIAEFKASGVPADVIERSQKYGESVARRVIAWADKDGYKEITGRAKYVIPKGTGLWEATPPDFVDPIDPYWSTTRPFTMDKPDQIKPEPVLKFSTSPKSEFYKQALDVYNVSKTLTPYQKETGLFWDCNPIHSHHFGHLNFTTRQISPGGHWLNITKIAAMKKDLGMMESLEAYALVSMSLSDAFLSCWTEKFKSNSIRPVTYIQRYIDSTWQPLIQTPPFPEYSSGHSTISAAAATMLTHLFGEMPIDDDTEVYLGTATRTFPNFMAAADEAAMSRLYGGIHYRRSNQMGTKNGIEIANHIWSKVRTRV